jgi:hypothetical protein
MKKHTRATKKEKYMRTVEVMNLMLKGWREPEIVEHLQRKWSIKSEVNIRRYIQAAFKEWVRNEAKNNSALREKYLDRLEMLFRSAVEKEHIKIALEVQKEINELSGMYIETKDERNAPEIITISAVDQSRPALPAAQSESSDSNDENQEG